MLTSLRVAGAKTKEMQPQQPRPTTHTPPDPDNFVNLADVPSPVSSPETEVYLHNRDVVRRRIAARQATVLQRLVLDEEERVRSAARATRAEEDDNNNDYDSDATIEYSQAVAVAAPLDPLQNLIYNCQTNQDNDCLDPPECVANTCPFCTGPLMHQRFVLAQRLVQLDRVLYGNPSQTHKA